MAYYITGDCHGQFRKLSVFCAHHETTIQDTMILLGDVGVNFSMDERDIRRKRFLSAMSITFLCVHGNHEERPENIPTYQIKEWHGGKVYYEPLYPNLLFTKDGEIYDLDGKKAIAVGGAYSVDKEFRIMTGIPWFSDEQPSAKIKAYVEQRLRENDWKMDYVFSHTCPIVYALEKKNYGFGKIDTSTEEWMGELRKKLQYECWYFGHFHENRAYTDAQLLYECILELGGNRCLQKLGEPMFRQGEQVIFSFFTGGSTEDGYGKIINVHRYGAGNQYKEVAYDILGRLSSNMEVEILFKNVVESEMMRMNES